MEIWKPIPNFEGFYEASNLGRIRSVDKYVMNHSVSEFRKGVVLTPTYHTHGYTYVTLSKLGVKKKYLIHRLVAMAFCDNPNNYKIINHIDGIKDNNIPSNLEWCTSSHNNKEALRLGLRIPNPQKGEKHFKAQITELQAIDILTKRLTKKEFMELYNISIHIINNLQWGRSWKHLPR